MGGGSSQRLDDSGNCCKMDGIFELLSNRQILDDNWTLMLTAPVKSFIKHLMWGGSFLEWEIALRSDLETRNLLPALHQINDPSPVTYSPKAPVSSSVK